MGEVYAVFDQQLGETVALKRMSLDAPSLLTSLRDEEAIARFRREVVVARKITHPNVARTHDIGEHGGRLFLTMELISGESLEERLARESGPLSAEEAARIGAAIARGLQAAHAADVVHRDLKPANVLLEHGGRVAITDFGVARSMAEGSGKASRIVGTPHYMAPEQILGERVGAAADVYALGLLLYEMLTDQPAFQAGESMATVLARCREAPTDPRAHVALSDPLAELVLQCLALDPAARPGAAEVASRLLALGEAHVATMAVSRASWPAAVNVSQPFAPLELGTRTLAVTRFAYRGPADHDYLGESLAQELIDVLSRIRGMRVLALGATRARDDKDPRAMGRDLGAEAIVDGTAMANGDRLRVAVRLLDVATGEQIWSDRYDGDLGDVFRMQETMSQRIADTLRVELSVAAHRGGVDARAMDAYLRARRELEYRQYHGAMQAVDLLEQCLEASPSFRPAIAAHAIASVRAWWMAFLERANRDWGETAKESVARALSQAPDLAESHLAAAVLALHLGDLRTTARKLAETLAIAPTCADAHRYLGDLQCEAGRVREGTARLELALELDPSLITAYYGLARVAALRGDDERFERFLKGAIDLVGEADPPVILMRMRNAVWRGDEATIAAFTKRLEASSAMLGPLMASFGRYLQGEGDPDLIGPAVEAISSTANARMATFGGQLVIEAHAHRQNLDHAKRRLRKIAEGSLVDVEWLERCPALEPLRDLPGFGEVRVRTRERAQQIWQL